MPWLRALADECHEHGTAVMIQLTHLGRRTAWNHADWLPVLAPSPVREPAHRAFPKRPRTGTSNASSASTPRRRAHAGGGAGRHRARSLRPSAGRFWSPATNQREDEYGGSLDNRLRFTLGCSTPSAAASARTSSSACGWSRTRTGTRASRARRARDRAAAGRSGQVDFLNVIRGHIETDAALPKVIPIQGMPLGAAPGLRGRGARATKFPVFHAARISDVATARHAIAEGKLDMVGMTRAHIADPHIARKWPRAASTRSGPASAPPTASTASTRDTRRCASTTPPPGREATMPQVMPARGDARRIVIVGAGPAGLEAARVCAERGHAVRCSRPPTQPGGQVRLAARVPPAQELIGIATGAWRVARRWA